ncbi:MAG: hypothetical protein GX309_05270 [Clostridiales bacterium]|nr:hypothetical protein [Clostridiales bacterium]
MFSAAINVYIIIIYLKNSPPFSVYMDLVINKIEKLPIINIILINIEEKP